MGSQGLNLQRGARWLINLELPWNPARIEQRIGRLDRIGQDRRVHATILVNAHAAESTLLESMCRRTIEARRQFGPATLAAAAPPGHLAVAAALIAGTPLVSSPAAAVVTPSTCYQRPARAQALVTARRRRLVPVWRGDEGPGRRPIVACGPLLQHPPERAAVAVVSTLLIDRSGALVERRLVAVGVSRPAQRWKDARTTIEQALPLLRRRVSPRLRRLQHTASRAAVRRMAAERAIARHLHLLTHPRQAQLGLFSQRAAAAFETARATAAFGAAAAARRLRLEEDRRHLDATVMVIEWIVERR